MSSDIINLKCYAKINLILAIYPKKKPDSLEVRHSLDSLFHSISLYDEMRLEKKINWNGDKNIKLALFSSATKPIKLRTKNYDLAKDNLLIRIYQFMQRKYNLSGIKISLKKNIPVGAGLGGGSSNAAALIVGLNKLYGLGLGFKEMKKIAAQFGSDIPFFLKGGMAWIEGGGEKVHFFNNSLDCSENKFILLYPNIFISSALAYQKNLTYLKLSRGKSLKYIKKKLIKIDQGEKQISKIYLKNLILNSIYNSFQEKTFASYPKLNSLFESINKKTNYVSLSGSGSCLFAWFNDIIILNNIYELLKVKVEHIYKIKLIDKSLDFK